MLWAYVNFSQLLIVWSGNLPEEIPWYIQRLHGGWQWLALGLVVFHFAMPFLMLLSRDVKRNAKLLGRLEGGDISINGSSVPLDDASAAWRNAIPALMSG